MGGGAQRILEKERKTGKSEKKAQAKIDKAIKDAIAAHETSKSLTRDEKEPEVEEFWHTQCEYDYFFDPSTKMIRKGRPMGAISAYPNGTQLKVKDGGTGWYILSSDSGKNRKTLVLASVCERMRVEEYSWCAEGGRIVNVPFSNRIVFTDLFLKLNNRFSSSTITAQLIGVIYAAVAAEVHLQGDGYWTAETFIDIMQRNIAMSQSSKHQIQAGKLGAGTLIHSPEMPLSGIIPPGDVVDLGSVQLKIPYHITREYEPYLLRQDFTVQCTFGEGIEIPPDDDETEETKLPMLSSHTKLHKEDGVSHRTYGMRFCATGVVHADTDLSRDNAAKRVFGATKNEALMRSLGAQSARLVVELFSKPTPFGVLFDHGVSRMGQTLSDVRSMLLSLENGRFDGNGWLRLKYAPVEQEWIPDIERLLFVNPYRTDGQKQSGDYRGCVIDPSSPLVAAQHFIAYVGLNLVDKCSRSFIMRLKDDARTASKRLWHGFAKNAILSMYPFTTRWMTQQLPHHKKEERVRFFHDTRIHDASNYMAESIDVSFKKHEIAKPTIDGVKVGRLTGSLGKACIYFPEGPGLVKSMLGQKHTYQIGKVTLDLWIITDPSPDVLSSAFTELHEVRGKPDHIVGVIFSDDGAVSWNLDNEVGSCDTDISSNDSHCDVLPFLLTYAQLRHIDPARAAGLIKHCMLPLNMRTTDGKAGFRVKMAGPIEASGVGITTVLNNNSNACIIAGFAHLIAGGMDPARALKSAGLLCGHELTLKHNSCTADLQFLKNSAFEVPGKGFLPFQNLGCLFKSFGSVQGDLDFKKCSLTRSQFNGMSVSERWEHFLGGVVRGWKNQPTNRILAAMRSRFCPNPDGFEVLSDSLTTFLSEDQMDLSMYDNDAAVMARYRLDDDEVEILVEAIRTCKLGLFFDLFSIRKIMNKDYDHPLY